jgi:hypothetical protein
MKTLVIHPADRTTDFLSEIYKDWDKDSYTLLRTSSDKKNLKNKIRNHDRVVMMGHGDGYGLFGFSSYFIHDHYADLLNEKQGNVFIWCNANQFMQRNDLKGFATGMIISEWDEAEYCMNIHTYTSQNITDSNTLFSESLKQTINLPVDDMIVEMKRLYDAESNIIIDYNKQNLFNFN